MTRIAVDLRMVSGAMHGLARYTLDTLQEMSRLRPDWEFLALARPGALEPCGLPGNVTPCPVSAPPFSLSEQWELPALLRRHAPDLYHATSVALPGLLGVLPLLRPARTPMVATLPDLTPLHFPRRGLEPAYFRGWVAPILRRCRRVLVFSAHTAEDARRQLGLPGELFRICPLGASEAWSRPAPEGARLRALARHGLEPPYALCLGNPKPHKNLEVALEAFRDPPAGLRLVVVSAPSRALEGWLAETPAARWLPHLPEEDLPSVLQEAAALILPSLYEGFGLPALEAMAAGVPVLSSRATSLPEVVGEAGLYFDPTRAESLRQGLERLLGDPNLQADLRGRGRARAALFSWRRTATIHLETYAQALGLPPEGGPCLPPEGGP